VANGPSGNPYHVYATAAAATSACSGGAANVAYVQTAGVNTYVGTTVVQGAVPMAKGAWTCLADAITAGFKPASCPAPDNMVWIDPNASKFWTDGSSGYGKGAGGYACRSFALKVGYQQGVGAGEFIVSPTPDLVTNCSAPNFKVWVSLDNKNAVFLDDPAAGKGKGGYSCSDVAGSHGYKINLAGASSADGTACKSPDVAVWVDNDDKHFFTPGSDGYRVRVGHGGFFCKGDALALGATDNSSSIVGQFTYDAEVKSGWCNSADHVVWAAFDTGGNAFTQHEAKAGQGKGLWVCANDLSKHGYNLNQKMHEADITCPGDVVVSTMVGLWAVKGTPNYGGSGAIFMCEIEAKDLGYSQDSSFTPTGKTPNAINASCKQVGDQAVYELFFMGPRGFVNTHLAVPLDDPMISPSWLNSPTSTANWTCGAKAKADGYVVGYIDFASAGAAHCSDDTVWYVNGQNAYLTSKMTGYGKGSGFYMCLSTANKEQLAVVGGVWTPPPPPPLPTTCSQVCFTKNSLQLSITTAVKNAAGNYQQISLTCYYDLDAITVDFTGTPQAIVITYGAKSDTFPANVQATIYGTAFGQSLNAGSAQFLSTGLQNAMARYGYLKTHQ
jgi:hypothetical protein